jgi:hypothetical protein
MTIQFLSVYICTIHSQQEIFLQLSAVQFFAFLLQENAESRIFCNPETCLCYDFCGVHWDILYNNPSNITVWS